MKDQLAALSELPRLIQEKVDIVSQQIEQMTHMVSFKYSYMCTNILK